MSSSPSHWGSCGSSRYSAVTMACSGSKPTAPTVVSESLALLSRWIGSRSAWASKPIAWAANDGVVMLKNTSAPDWARLVICDSTVGSLVS